MKATTCLVHGWNLTRDELLRFKEWIITNLRLFGQRVILLIIPRTQILNTFLPYFDKRPMLFSLLCPNNEKAGHRGGRETYKWCRWKRENSFFDARQSRVGPRSELMTRYNEPHAREHKDTPGWEEIIENPPLMCTTAQGSESGQNLRPLLLWEPEFNSLYLLSVISAPGTGLTLAPFDLEPNMWYIQLVSTRR